MNGIAKTIECCGYGYKTNFCPQCGTQLRPKTVLEEAIEHFASTRRTFMTAVETYKRKGDERRLKYAEASLLKFTRLVDGLREIQSQLERPAK